MKTPAPSSRIVLPHHGLSRLVGPVRVQCDSGTLWITVDGKPDDIFLQPGAAHEFAQAEHVIVYALGGSATLRACTSAATRGVGARLRQGMQRLLGPVLAGARA